MTGRSYKKLVQGVVITEKMCTFAGVKMMKG